MTMGSLTVSRYSGRSEVAGARRLGRYLARLGGVATSDLRGGEAWRASRSSSIAGSKISFPSWFGSPEDQGALASSGGVLAASWSFNRCFSANVSAAILFEKVARTGPLLSPSLTAKNAPSWLTTYVAISLIWHSSLQSYSAEPVDRPYCSSKCPPLTGQIPRRRRPVAGCRGRPPSTSPIQVGQSTRSRITRSVMQFADGLVGVGRGDDKRACFHAHPIAR
jgi:hypothetical protein